MVSTTDNTLVEKPKRKAKKDEQGEFMGFKTLRELHVHLREQIGSGYLVCPISGEEIPNDINDI